ncbi:MAG: PP2C family protein-serine/threonine phosphatase [Planctomycetota bacterium]
MIDACSWADLAERLPQHLPSGLAVALYYDQQPTIACGRIDPAWPRRPLLNHPEIHIQTATPHQEALDHLLAALCSMVTESQSLSAELAATYGKLALLDELGRILPRCQDAAALGRGLADSLADMISGCGCLLQQTASEWRCLASWGRPSPHPTAMQDELERLCKRRRPDAADNGSLPGSLGLGPECRGPSCSIPLLSTDGVEGVLLLARPQGPPFASDEIKMAELAAVQCAGYLLKIRRDQAIRQAELLAHEVRLAGRIQKQLLPAALPTPAGYEVAAALASARLVGGDYYDALQTPDGLYLVVADVSGHSVPASLAMSMVRTALRAALPSITEPSGLIAALNQQLADDLFAATLFVSMAILRIDPDSGAFTLASAGHPPVLQRHADGSLSALDVEGFVLGMVPEQRPDQLRSELLPGETLLLYTDGVIELDDAAGIPFGEARLHEIVGTGPAQAPALLRNIEQRLRQWNRQRHDDTTLLACSRAPGAQALRQSHLLTPV